MRYFGGTKLGVGGLISAYKTAAEDSLSHAVIIEKEVLQHYVIRYSYVSTPEVMKLVKEYELEIRNQSFESECEMEATLPLRLKINFEEKVRLLNALGTTMSIVEIPLS